MQNFSTFSLACLFYFTFGPKSFVHRWTVNKNSERKIWKSSLRVNFVNSSVFNINTFILFRFLTSILSVMRLDFDFLDKDLNKKKVHHEM